MKWLITGGAGFIGTNLTVALANAGEDCIVTDNFHRLGARVNREFLKERHGIAVQTLDVRLAHHVDMILSANRDIDVIAHLAGQVSLVASLDDPRYDFETNALGTFNVLEAARRFTPNARVIFASTNKVYGDLHDLRVDEAPMRYTLPDYPDGLDESLPIELHGGYACSKGAADRYVCDYRKVYGLQTVSLRQSSIYGGHQFATEDQGWVAWFVQMGVRGMPFHISGTGRQVRDLLHVADLCECFRAVAQLPNSSAAWGEAFNIGGGPATSLSLLELFDILRNTYGFPMNFDAGPAQPGDQKVFIADTRKAREILGWSPSTAIVSGLEEIVTWSKSQWSAF